MTTKRDYYNILGIEREASINDIKSAYRKLAMDYHPDRNKSPDAEEKFKEISEAYAVLSDQKKRDQYNKFGHIGIDQRYSQEDIFRNVNFEDILRDIGIGIRSSGGIGESIFNIFFGSEGGRRGRHENPSRGKDILYRLEIGLEDAAIGTSMELEVPRTEIRNTCFGSGAKPGTFPKTCPTCHGGGNVNRTQDTPLGKFTATSICVTCRGTGTVVDSPCDICNGLGTIKKMHRIQVKIPVGVDSGSRLRVPSEGEPGRNGGPSGDIYVEIIVRPHTTFVRNDKNLIMETTISFIQAIFGCEIIVPTIDGKVEIKIQPGTQNGHILRLKGKGIQNIYTSGKGDQLVKIKVEVPTKLTDEQKDLLREFAIINEKNNKK